MKYFIFFMFIWTFPLASDEGRTGVLITHPCERAKESVKSPSTSAEQYALYECRQNIRKQARDLRIFIEKKVAETVPGFLQKIRVLRQLNPYIDALERDGLNCCQSLQPTESCAEPLVRQLELWNSEGLPIDKKE
jgi:hypothetical protein